MSLCLHRSSLGRKATLIIAVSVAYMYKDIHLERDSILLWDNALAQCKDLPLILV